MVERRRARKRGRLFRAFSVVAVGVNFSMQSKLMSGFL